MSNEHLSLAERWKQNFEQMNPQVASSIQDQLNQQTLPPILQRPSEPSENQAYARLWTESLRQCEQEDAIDPVIEAVIDVRKSMGMTQAALARCLDISPRTLGEWEQGKRHPSGAARTLLQWVVESPEKLRAAHRVLKHRAR